MGEKLGTDNQMKKITDLYYTFDEFESLLRRCFFQDKPHSFRVEVVDTYYWRIEYYPVGLPDDQELYMSDFDALPAISKVVGMRIENTHVSQYGIWLEGQEILPPKQTKKKRWTIENSINEAADSQRLF